MIELNIDGKLYYHPSKIEEVTLRQWVAIMSAERVEGEVNVINEIKAFSEFSGIPVGVLTSTAKKSKTGGYDYDVLLFHINEVQKMLSNIDHADTDKPKSFKLKGKTYYVCQDIDAETMDKYIACTHYMNKMNSSPEFYAYMLAIYCTRKNEKTISDSTKLEARSEIMLELNVLEALRINAFFLNTSEAYLKDSQLYLAEK